MTRLARRAPGAWLALALGLWLLTTTLHAAVSRTGTPVTGLREGSTGTTLDSASGTFTTGNTLVVAASIYSPGTEEISSITGGGNTFTALTACEDAGNNRLRIFYSVNITGGSFVLTLTPSASVDYAALVVSEYAGVSAFDTAVPCAFGSGTSLTSGTFTTAGAGLVYTAAVADNITTNFTADAAYTLRTTDWFFGRGDDQDRITTGVLTGSAATMTGSASGNWLFAGAAFTTTTSAASGLSLLGVGR